MTRNVRRTIVLVLLGGLILPACGDDERTSAADQATSTAASGQAFPVTIEHKYGSTEIAARPERIVTVGLNEQDALWALGVAPVAVTDWLGLEHGIGPWAEKAAAAAGPKPELLSDVDGIRYEKIAAQRPDAIIALYTGITRDEYEKLAALAPTVAPPAGVPDWGIPWQDATRIIGKVVGRPREAERLVDGLEGRIEQEREAHPEFRGKTAAVVSHTEDIWVYGRDDARSRLLASLGFELSRELMAFVGDGYTRKLSDERADLLDVDALTWLIGRTERKELESKRVYTCLPMHLEGRDVFIERERPDRAVNAIEFQTPLSIAQALNVLVPALEAAVDGDPTTTSQEN